MGVRLGAPSLTIGLFPCSRCFPVLLRASGHLAKFGCSGATATRILRDSALLSDLLYGTGITSLRPQLRRWSDAKLHVVVVTVKDSAFTSRSFASAVRTLLATGRFAVRCMARVRGSSMFEVQCTVHRRRICLP